MMSMQLRTHIDTMVARVTQAAHHIKRVRYRENQRVRAADLRDDQAYHVAMRRRHLLGAHDWGIVSGLALSSPDSISEDISVQPGIAVDIYGRMLTLPQPLNILLDDLRGFADGDIDIGIRYRLSPAGGSRCDEDGEVFAAVNIDRNIEANYLQLEDFPENSPPVYLGTIKLAGGKLSYSASSQQPRRYTRFYASSVLSPDGKTVAALGSENENDPRRFTVAALDSEKNTSRDQMVINRVGDAFLYGNINLQAASPDTRLILRMAGSSLHLEPHAPPKTAQPWRMYAVTGIEGEGDAQKPFTEMRIELFHPGNEGDPGNYRLEINAPNGVPLFTVVADGTVIARGNVKADEILVAPVTADPTDPRFQELLEAAGVPVIGNQGLQVESILKTAFPNRTIRPTCSLTNTLASKEVIEGIEVYADIRANGSTPLFNGRVQNQLIRLTADAEQIITLAEIQGQSEGTDLLVLIVAYGTRANGDVVVGSQKFEIKVREQDLA